MFCRLRVALIQKRLAYKQGLPECNQTFWWHALGRETSRSHEPTSTSECCAEQYSANETGLELRPCFLELGVLLYLVTATLQSRVGSLLPNLATRPIQRNAAMHR